MGFTFNLKLALKAAVFYIIFISMGFGITGRTNRTHYVAPADSLLQIAGQAKTAEQLAEQFQPKLLVPKDLDSGEPQAFHYEVSELDGEYIITYRVAWNYENHPNLVMDVVRKLHNLVYYGLNFRDYEYIQLNIDPSNGNITKMMCPTPSHENDDRATLVATRQGSEVFSLDVRADGNSLKSRSDVSLSTAPPLLKVADWNHLMVFAEENDQASSNLEERLPLEYLDKETYRWEKFPRRDHGEVHTEKSPANAPIIFFVSPIFLAYFVFIQRDYMLRSQRLKTQRKDEGRGSEKV